MLARYIRIPLLLLCIGVTPAQARIVIQVDSDTYQIMMVIAFIVIAVLIVVGGLTALHNHQAFSQLGSGKPPDQSPAIPYRKCGDAYYAVRDYDNAITAYTQALGLDIKDATARFGRGDAYDAKGDLDRAIADYAQAIRLDPRYTTAYYDRGTAYYAKGDYDRAIADYTEAITARSQIRRRLHQPGQRVRRQGRLRPRHRRLH